jgi:hypothetical protein
LNLKDIKWLKKVTEEGLYLKKKAEKVTLDPEIWVRGKSLKRILHKLLVKLCNVM